VPDKLMQMQRAYGSRPRMIAIAGDSAAGKTTLSKGLVAALGEDRSVTLCVDDYHKYDRQERKELPFTPLSPECNYIDVMEQHLQLLATGQPILKPVYDHATGELDRPEYVEPRDFIIIEGLLPLHTKLMRACFDVNVYLDPPEEIRYEWKIARDTSKRGYEREQVTAELDKREPESEAYIRPQREFADIVVRFAPVEGHDNDPLSATLLLRPNVKQPHLTRVLGDENGSATSERAMHLKMARDAGGNPVDALHVHGHAPPEETEVAKKLLWESLGRESDVPDSLGKLSESARSEPLALTQLVMLYYMLANVD